MTNVSQRRWVQWGQIETWETAGIRVLTVTMNDWYIWAMLNHMVEHIEIKGIE